MNLLAFVIFKLAGVGLVQANLSGSIPALATLVLVYISMRKVGGEVAASLAVFNLGFCYVHIVYSRVPMVESLEILMLLACFLLLLGGLGRRFLCGLLIGLAALMVKMHALHFLPVAALFLWLERHEDRSGGFLRSILAVAAGVVVAGLVWYLAVYRVNPSVVVKYFKSNIFVAQRGEYTNATLFDILTRRIGALVHLGSGRDGLFVKVPVLYALGAAGSLSVLSGFGNGKRETKAWERLALIWLVGIMASLSILSYRPLRYLALIIPSLALVATSFQARLAEGKGLLAATKPRWFALGFSLWFAAVLIHVYQDIVFRLLRSGGASRGTWLVTSYQSVWLKIAICLAIGVALWFMVGTRLRASKGLLTMRLRQILLFGSLAGLVISGSVRFGDYVSSRKYSIIDAARSLDRILGEDVFMVGDCSTTLSLETDFKTLPAYGDLIRYDERERFEAYPVTHFLLRFPTLYEYLTRTYPDFAKQAIPVRTFVLCGREATVVRYKQWPGLGASNYQPTDYEIGMEKISKGDYAGALEVLERFLDSNPDSHEALVGMAICHAHLGRMEQALRMIDRALGLTDRDPMIYEIQGDILSSLGRANEARRAWRRALKLNPNSRKLRAKIARGR